MCCESLPDYFSKLQVTRFASSSERRGRREKRKSPPFPCIFISPLPFLFTLHAVHFALCLYTTLLTNASFPFSIGTNMLARPGEAREKSTPNTQRRKKVTSEDPNDTVRRLQRLPPNKACADCTSKPAQCVNLNHGTFVCMACSGVQ